MDQNLKYQQYAKLGPFEIKDFLAKVATKSAEEASLTYLNAGRGNPNWVATEPREAFFLLGQFAVTESKRVLDLPPGVGVSGLESDGGDRFFCGGGGSGKVRAVRRPKRNATAGSGS